MNPLRREKLSNFRDFSGPMDASQIVSNIEKHVCLSEEERAYWKSFLVFKFVQKNEHILTEGEFCQQLHFVNSGTLRAYFLNHEGKETTVMFAIKDWWITDMFSFAKEPGNGR